MQANGTTLDDLVRECAAHFERKEEAEENIFIDGEYIVIREPGSFSYEIPLFECATICGAIRWLKHMAEKNWVTEEKLWRIADLIVETDINKNGGRQ